tara:strand:+ start:1733 stop:2254 length:522 start_codon:yes stop_codon:yes gene_type:complete
MIISVIGSSSSLPHHSQLAFDLGLELSKHPKVDYVVCGGMSGIMQDVCNGVRTGILEGFECKTIGILPGNDKSLGNEFIDIPIVTGMGFARNIVVALTGDIVIAVGGAYGTLSELGHSLSEGRPVIALDSWNLETTGEGENVSDKSSFTRTTTVDEAIGVMDTLISRLNNRAE